MEENGGGASQQQRSNWLTAFRKRKQFVVDQRLQSKLLLYSFRHILIVVLAVAFVLFTPSIAVVINNDVQSEQAVRAAAHLLHLHASFWTTAVLVVILVAADSIRLSHKIAGPLHRFRKALREWRTGEIPQRIQLREGDLLLDFCDEVNVALDDARAQRAALDQRDQELLRLVEQLQVSNDGSGDELGSARVRETLSRMKVLVGATRADAGDRNIDTDRAERSDGVAGTVSTDRAEQSDNAESRGDAETEAPRGEDDGYETQAAA